VVRLRVKPCALCGRAADILYRVRQEAGGRWLFVCPTCWPTLSTANPDYVYGGTWKAAKR
jgi:hypothetical protein